MKTADLIGPALDWAVAKAEGVEFLFYDPPRGEKRESPSTNWEQGGPIIERERIFVKPKRTSAAWRAYQMLDPMGLSNDATGPTPLVAAMRCFVASKLGNEVETPEELK